MALIQRIRLSFVALIFFRIIPVYSDQACILCDEHETLDSLRSLGGGETCRSLNDDLSLIPSDSADCQRYRVVQWYCCTSNAPPSLPPSLPPTASPQKADFNFRFGENTLRIAIFICLAVVMVVTAIYNSCHQSEPTPSTQNQQASSSDDQEAETSTTRQELFLQKFRFQTVLDKSKINHDEEKGLEDHTSQCTDMEDGDNGKDDDDNSKISPDDGNLAISSWRQLLMLSSWRKPSRDDECCICLERYEPGQTICSAATDQCKHVFHEDCMMHWFQDKDTCPICRVNFIES